MKRVVLAIVLVAFFIGGCKKRQIKKIEKAMVEGSWKVTKFVEDGVDETSDYDGAIFIFSSNGSVVVTQTSSYTGTWDVAKENDSDDDDISDDKHVEFILNLPMPFDELSDDWEIESNSESKLSLKDKSGKDDSIDYLVLEKI